VVKTAAGLSPPPAAPAVPTAPVVVPALPAAPVVARQAVAAVQPVQAVQAISKEPPVASEDLRRQAVKRAAEERAQGQRLTVEQGELILEATGRASTAREQATAEECRTPLQSSAVCVASDDPFAVLDMDGGGAGTAIRFHIDERLTGIDYSSVEDIVEFHQSLNTVRLTPDNHPIQSGWAAVTAVRQRDTIHVFIALLLLDSCEVLVYVPSQQPERAADYGQIMGAALNFVEVAGFMMDCENFQTGGDNYALVLRRKTSGR
jgi:hypothetical protein